MSEISGASLSRPRNRITLPNLTAPGAFAMLATRYFDRYGMDREAGKETLAKISVNSHRSFCSRLLRSPRTRRRFA